MTSHRSPKRGIYHSKEGRLKPVLQRTVMVGAQEKGPAAGWFQGRALWIPDQFQQAGSSRYPITRDTHTYVYVSRVQCSKLWEFSILFLNAPRPGGLCRGIFVQVRYGKGWNGRLLWVWEWNIGMVEGWNVGGKSWRLRDRDDEVGSGSAVHHALRKLRDMPPKFVLVRRDAPYWRSSRRSVMATMGLNAGLASWPSEFREEVVGEAFLDDSFQLGV